MSTIWIGNIHFGNTDVPVKLYPAVSQNIIQFHLLHKTDRVKLRQQMICAFEKTPVNPEEQVKGFLMDERKYILIDPAEIEETEPEESRTIKVSEFIKTGGIDPVFMERTYYLEPGESSKNYSALAAALKETDTQGICTWVMRKRAYFGALESTGKALRLGVLRFSDEIIPAKTLGLEEFPLSEKELDIGSELINRLTVAFQPEKYKNEHYIKLQALIDKKMRGGKITLLKPRHVKPTAPGRLLDALEKSLKKVA